jgi:hypothetical protein
VTARGAHRPPSFVRGISQYNASVMPFVRAKWQYYGITVSLWRRAWA